MQYLAAAWEYIVVFILAAIPWIEIAVVIPLAILKGLNAMLVGLVSFIGNLTTVFLLIVFIVVIETYIYTFWTGRGEINEQGEGAVGKKRGLNALVVEGGAMRGIFSTGVLDAFIEKDFNPFDLCLGVSAGASNLAAYLARMYQRNYKVYTNYSVRPQFINWLKFIRGGHLVDLDWLWDITIKEIRLDIDRIIKSDKEFLIGVTEVRSGKPVYLKPDRGNMEDILKASSAIPVFYRNFVRINGDDYADGALVDPIPVMEAYRRKAVNIMVIRSRPYSYEMQHGLQTYLSKFYLRKYPRLTEAIWRRPQVYQQSVAFMRNPPQGVRIMEVNPPDSFATRRLTKDVHILKRDYKAGYESGLEIIERWKKSY